MLDLEAEMERAVSLYICGKAEEAAEIAGPLLRRARGTPHAARFYRYMSEFMLATGDYERSREAAREAGSLARAIRHPGEILASTLMILACDFYEGHLRQVHRQLEELLHLAVDQPMPIVFMGQVTLLLGDFDRTVSLLEQARGFVDEVSEPDAHPAMDLFRSNMLIQTGKAHLLAERVSEAIALLERAVGLRLHTPVPGTLAQALLGCAVAHPSAGAPGELLRPGRHRRILRLVLRGRAGLPPGHPTHHRLLLRKKGRRRPARSGGTTIPVTAWPGAGPAGRPSSCRGGGR